MTTSIGGTTGVTFPDTSVQPIAAGSYTMGFKNRIINGAMVIDQRNAGASVTAQDSFPVDRFKYEASQASKFTLRQNAGSVTLPAGFINYLGATSSSSYSITSTDYFVLSQKIEGLNAADLAWGTASAATVTLSFRVYSSLTGTFGGALLNSAQNRSYPFSYSIPTANTWTTISITIAGDTSGTWLTTSGTGISLRFSLGTGTSFSGTAGAWAGSLFFSATGATSVVGTNGATFYITGVQLEKGSTATSFDVRPYGTELALAQRYFRKTDPSGSYGEGSIFGYNTTNQSIGQAIPFPVQMRSTPTIAYGGTWVVTNASQLLLGGGQSSYLAYLSVTATGAAQSFGNTSGFITFSSEL